MTNAAKDRKSILSDHLITQILTMSFKPGEDLDEAALSDAFGLSRTPLREVFRELAGQGYVELRAGRGARVADLSYKTLHDFFLAAPMIYGAIQRLAAENATLAQIDRLKDAQRAFATALDTNDPMARSLANNRFHQVTGEMAGNIYLLPSFQRLLIDHARISMTFYRPHPAGMSATLIKARDQHDAMIAAIEARDANAAAALADDHWQLSRNQIQSFVMPAALDVPMGSTT